jgi:hypothetical protein
MGIASPFYGGKRRVIVSKLAEATFGTAASFGTGGSTAYVLNPLGDSGGLYPPGIDLVDNSNSAQGQAELGTLRQSHAQDHQGSYKFDLTPEAFGLWSSSALGADAYSAVTGGGEHLITQSANVLFGRTVAEHIQGAGDTTDAALFSGVYANTIGLNITPGNRFCTMTVDTVAAKAAAAADDSAHDATGSWPAIIGLPPTKMSFIVKDTTAYASAGTSVTDPTSAGQIINSISGTDFSRYIKNLDWKYNNNIDLAEQYSAGTGTTAGFYRGQPYPTNRTWEVTGTFWVDSTSAAFIRFEKGFVDATQQGFGLQISGVSDYMVGTTNPSGLSILMPAMSMKRPTFERALGAMTMTATWYAMQPASGSRIYIYTWDDYAKEYDATS